MGLDLHLKNEESRWHASYSGVQRHRIKCILAFAKRLRREFPLAKQTLENVVKCLPPAMGEQCLKTPEKADEFLAGRLPWPTQSSSFGGFTLSVCHPNYANVGGLRVLDDTPEEAGDAILGLECWVNHSDCDGSHSPKEAKLVLAMLGFVSPVLPQEEPWDKKWEEDLHRLYAAATSKGKKVIFS